MRRHVRAFAANAALLLAATPNALHAAVLVHAIRVGLDPDHSRVVLESDGPIHAQWMRDSHPGTLRLDLPGVTLNSTLLGLGKAIGRNNPFINSVKLSPSDDGTLLELDTPSGVGSRLFNLQPGGGHADRLVLDLFADREALAPPTPPPAATTMHDTSSPARVAAVRVGVEPDRVRLVLEANRPIQASVVQPTTAGASMAIDLGRMAADSVLADLPGLIEPNPYLKDIRIERAGADTRLVLIATQQLTPQIFTLQADPEHGSRLVIDLVPEQALPAPVPAPAVPPETAVASAAPVPSETLPVPPPLPSATAGLPQANLRETWLKVYLNGKPARTVMALRDAAGHVLLQAADLERLRIRTDGAARITHGGADYSPLSAIHGLAYRVDPGQGTLLLTLPPALLEASELSGVSHGPNEPTPPPPGAWLNYDVFADQEQRAGTATSALLQAGVFNRWGSGSNTLLARRMDGHVRTVRLDSTWTHDMPDSMASLRIGDSISGAASWGRSIRFGGVQWATNFETRPDFITLPTLTLGGVAVAPSTVDYYVDDVLRLRRDVPTGPFTIQDLPVVTGQGEVRMVVHDLLGREQVVTQPFYASSGLLARGLRDFSYEIGFERENYGLDSNDYGRLAAIGTERLGISDSFTGELHAEFTRHQQTAGIGADWLVANSGVATAAVAASQDGNGSGELLELGFQHQSAYLSYGFRTQFTTPRFTQLGYEQPERPPRQATSAYVSFGSGNSGSLGLNYTREDFRDGQPDVDFVGASYSRALGRFAYLTLSGLRFLGEHPSSLLTLSMTMPLGPLDSLSLNAQAQAGDRHGNVQYQHNLPAGSGAGYRVQAGLSSADPDLAEVSLQNGVGTYTLGAASVRGQHAYQASVRGGLVLLGDKLFASRSIDGSFALVQVPGFPNVRVYQDNQQVATTDSSGYALLPRLRPYQDNPIRIEQADLPLDAEIRGLSLDAVPYYHSGLLLKFPVMRSHGAVLTIKLPDGGFLPEGAGVRIEGNPTVFPVGTGGEVYLTGLQPLNHLHVMWQGRSCDITLPFRESSIPLPQLGPVTCGGITP
jgi:outer membrane usher protein